MKRFECVIAPVKTPQEEETVIVEAVPTNTKSFEQYEVYGQDLGSNL